MADSRTVTIDRHVLASSASSINLAWRSFGWTPAIAGGRATRLEEEVPWGTLADRSASPGWLAGTPAAIVHPDNLDRLQWAFLPLDGRLGLSVWGATGRRSAAAGTRRVLTHTLLFDEDTFRALAGFPFGLLGTARNPAGWLQGFEAADAFVEPTGLEAIRLTVGATLTRAFETARIAEVRRLRTVALERFGGDAHRLAYRVARIYEALAETVENGSGHDRRVAIRDDLEGAALLTRLVWLSLPLADRLRIWFSTEQARTERPRAHLMVLPIMEWGRASPPATQVVELDEMSKASDPASGRAQWAALAAGPAEGKIPVAVLRRADARGWSVLRGGPHGASAAVEVARLLETWHSTGPNVRVAQEIARVEADRARPRAHAVGALLARSVREADLTDQGVAESLVELCRSVGLDAGAMLNGATRALLRSGPGGATPAGFTRCFSCLGAEGPEVAADLSRLGGREHAALGPTLGAPDGLAALVLAGTAALRAGAPLADSEAGRRVLDALRPPDRVAAVLAAGTRIPLGPFLDLIGADPEILARGIDAAGPRGLEPESLSSLIASVPSSEALSEMVRIWDESGSGGPGRLQFLGHPAWRSRPDVAHRAFRAMRDGLTAASERKRPGPDRAREGLEGLLAPWRAAVVRGARLDKAESLMIVELLGRLASGRGASERLGEAAAVGQRTGGEVLGSPAVSPSDGCGDLVAALSIEGIVAALEQGPGALPHRRFVTAILANPEVLRIEDPASLDRLLRLLWAEWTPDLGVPSLRAAVVEHGAGIGPLLGRLLAAPAPIPLGSVLRALRPESRSDGSAETAGSPARTIFLRAGGPE